MSDPVMLAPGEGRRIVGGALDATVKVASSHPALMSTFEMIIPPGYDVGAHVHAHGEEVFYVVEGELDVLALHPVDRELPDWYEWESATGQRYMHGGAGAFMFVPENVPHAFANRTSRPAKIFFQSSVPGGHENYFDELMALLRRSDGKPDVADIAALRRRYDIEQLTPLRRDLAPLRPQQADAAEDGHEQPEDGQTPARERTSEHERTSRHEHTPEHEREDAGEDAAASGRAD